MRNYAYIIFALSVIFLCPMAGGILAGLNRKLFSFINYRRGSSILQPFYDVLKLFWKENRILNPFQMEFVLLNLIFIIFALIFIFTGQDLLLVIGCIAFAELCRVIALMIAKSPFFRIYERNEIINILVYITLLLTVSVNIRLITGSFMTKSIYALSKSLIYDTPLTYLITVFAVLLKLGRAPFDYCAPRIRNRGSLERLNAGFSGAALALINIFSWYETVLLLFLVSVFIKPLWIGTLIALSIYFLSTIADCLIPTSTWRWTLEFWWPVAGLAAITNIVWVCLGS